MQKLVRELSKLPTIGEKTALRLAYHLVNNNKDLAKSIAQSLINAAENVHLCKECYFLAESDLCSICKSASSRDEKIICVVEKPVDLVAIEKIGEYTGLFHVLHGLWSPVKGVGAENMKIDQLLERIEKGNIQEIIIALSSNLEGDATALYIARLLEEKNIRVSRLAQGMPKGGELEYADDVTLSRAFAGRTTV